MDRIRPLIALFAVSALLLPALTSFGEDDLEKGAAIVIDEAVNPGIDCGQYPVKLEISERGAEFSDYTQECADTWISLKGIEKGGRASDLRCESNNFPDYFSGPREFRLSWCGLSVAGKYGEELLTIKSAPGIITCTGCADCNKKIEEAPKGSSIRILNDISSPWDCIEIREKTGITLDCQNNEIQGNGGTGVSIYFSEGITVINCGIEGFSNGVEAYESTNNIISSNQVYQGRGEGYGIYLKKCSGSVVEDCGISGFSYCIDVSNSAGNQIKRNNASHCIEGISLAGAEKSVVSGNRANYNVYGIDILWSNDNEVSQNVFKYNEVGGMTIRGDSTERNSLEENEACFNKGFDAEISKDTKGNNPLRDNKCDKAGNWNDENAEGCKNACEADGAETAVAAPFPQGPFKWTFMLYNSGDNTLNRGAFNNLINLESFGSTNEVCVLSQTDFVDVPAKRYKIMKDTNGRDPVIVSVVEEIGEVEMSDPGTLTDYVDWAKAECPADRYALILMDHGRGWRGLMDDMDPEGYMSMAELGKALSAAGGIDLLGFDACLMQMIEVASVVKGKCSVMVGSEAVEEVSWEYGKILQDLNGNPDMDEKELGKIIVDRYAKNSRLSSSSHKTLSAVSAKTGDVNKIEDSVRSLVSSLENADEYTISSAREFAQQFMGGTNLYDHVDLYDLSEWLSKHDEVLKPAAEKVMKSINDAVIAETHGKDERDSHGISIYFPATEKEYDKEYDNTEFSRITRWNEFLKKYYEKKAQENG